MNSSFKNQVFRSTVSVNTKINLRAEIMPSRLEFKPNYSLWSNRGLYRADYSSLRKAAALLKKENITLLKVERYGLIISL